MSEQLFTIEYLDPKTLRPNPRNWRKHPERQQEALRASIEEFGWLAVPIFNRRTGRLIDGHARAHLAARAGDEAIPVRVIDVDEPTERRILAAFDRIGELREVDDALLASLLRECSDEGPMPPGWDEDDLSKLLAKIGETPVVVQDEPKVAAPERVNTGEVWQLGRHRLGCGDCTNEHLAARVLADATPLVLLTDPPYCSGGWQESDRRIGSVDTDRKKKGDPKIANDTLSTRGFQALIRGALGTWPAGIAYVFTDWRMWVPLFDVMEGAGFGVRSMIVWDKEHPGMGKGWRAQHELIMCGCRVRDPFDTKRGSGNVIQCKRTGNELHDTQKPVELLAKLLTVSSGEPVAVADPFAGSGSTLVTAEQMGWACYAAELEPRHCDTIVARWESLTGQKAERVDG
jgi:DNA modification methylase